MTFTQILNPLKTLAAIALVALAAGCATNTINDGNLAGAAGFKIITPVNAQQRAILAKLPANQVSPITYQGKPYYVLPDAMNNMVYVGGPAEYQSYQNLRVQKQLSNENLEAAQMNSMNSMDWGGWGGWGGVGFGGMGFRR